MDYVLVLCLWGRLWRVNFTVDRQVFETTNLLKDCSHDKGMLWRAYGKSLYDFSLWWLQYATQLLHTHILYDILSVWILLRVAKLLDAVKY